MLLEVEDLSVWFAVRGEEIPIVQELTYSVDVGEVLGVVGESGSGKSVSCLSLVGLVPSPPLSRMTGRVRFDGRELLGAPEKALRNVRGKEIAFIFQEPMTALNPVMRVGAQIGEAIRAHERSSRRAARDRTLELLHDVGIPSPEQRIDDYPHQLSGGMRQRVMIAMALAPNPRLLIADEPTTALDVTVQAQVLALLRRLQRERGLAVLFVTHDFGVIAEVADRVLVMHDGRRCEYADVDHVFHEPQDAQTKRLLSYVASKGR